MNTARVRRRPPNRRPNTARRAQLVGPTCVASVYRAGVRGTCGLVVSRQASSDFVQLHDVEHFDLTVLGVIPDLKSRTEHVTEG